MAIITHDGTSIPSAPPKDPNSVIAYGFDWTSWLDTTNSETISTSSWVSESGLSVSAENVTGNICSATLSGGTVGYTYILTNRITTSFGRTEDRSMYIQIKEL